MELIIASLLRQKISTLYIGLTRVLNTMLRMGYTTPWTSCNYWPESPIIKGLTVSQHSSIDQRVQHYGFHIGLTEVFQTKGITKVSHIIRKLNCYQYLREKNEIIIQHLDKRLWTVIGRPLTKLNQTTKISSTVYDHLRT